MAHLMKAVWLVPWAALVGCGSDRATVGRVAAAGDTGESVSSTGGSSTAAQAGAATLVGNSGASTAPAQGGGGTAAASGGSGLGAEGGTSGPGGSTGGTASGGALTGGTGGGSGATTSLGGSSGNVAVGGTSGDGGAPTGGGTSTGTGGNNCALLGCAAPPLCSTGCTATCGCCPCSEGSTQGALVCTDMGCWAPAEGGGGQGGVSGEGGSAGQGGAEQAGDSGAAICVVGMDQTCNDNPAISSLHGTCQPDGTCRCNEGYSMNAATGRCY